MTGVETRTSSPIRIRRDDHYQSIGLTGLYPAGEGAGYAGGILSAGVDGIRVAEAVALEHDARHGRKPIPYHERKNGRQDPAHRRTASRMDAAAAPAATPMNGRYCIVEP